MDATIDRSLTSALDDATRPLTGSVDDFDPLLDRIGDAHLVLLGEASHGTHEFYRIRGEITKRLISEKGFDAVAVEADWPDAFRVNRYVRGRPGDGDASEALGGFRRFPQWMWRNADVLDFVGWLREYNDALPVGDERVGFYGLDLYSLHASMHAVIDYLRVVDEAAAARAIRRYACFDEFGGDPQSYGQAAVLGLAPSCEREVMNQLVELRASAAEYAGRDGRLALDDLFFAQQNAQVVTSAERYYRTMFLSNVSCWNLRDRHMVETLESLLTFLAKPHRRAKVVVWAHNSHLGDARATEMNVRGEVNVGQLVRQRHDDDAVLVGCTTYAGTVTAASAWDGVAERKVVRPALAGSYEELFHRCARPKFYLDLGLEPNGLTSLGKPRLERAIGVIYRPETERLSHYFTCQLTSQFDVVLHYDHTRAVEPLERSPLWERPPEVPETYPSSL